MRLAVGADEEDVRDLLDGAVGEGLNRPESNASRKWPRKTGEVERATRKDPQGIVRTGLIGCFVFSDPVCGGEYDQGMRRPEVDPQQAPIGAKLLHTTGG